MLRSCCACAKVTPRHKTVTKTLRCVLPAELGMTRKPHKRYETRAIDGQRTGTDGLFRCGAFRAAHTTAHQSKYSGVVSPQARIAGHLTFHPQIRFRLQRGFLLSCPTVWPVCYIPPTNSLACIYDLQMHNSDKLRRYSGAI